MLKKKELSYSFNGFKLAISKGHGYILLIFGSFPSDDLPTFLNSHYSLNIHHYFCHLNTFRMDSINSSGTSFAILFTKTFLMVSDLPSTGIIGVICTPAIMGNPILPMGGGNPPMPIPPMFMLPMLFIMGKGGGGRIWLSIAKLFCVELKLFIIGILYWGGGIMLLGSLGAVRTGWAEIMLGLTKNFKSD